MTKLEIIDETVKFYSEDSTRRSVENKSCLYNSSDGRHCAVGRCLLPEYKEQGTKFNENCSGIDAIEDIFGALDNLLDKQYRGHSLTFWCNLQYLHDKESFWDETGLTVLGKDFVEEIREKYGKADEIDEVNKIRELAERFGVTESQITYKKDK